MKNKILLLIFSSTIAFVGCTTSKKMSTEESKNENFEGYIVYGITPIKPKEMPLDQWLNLIELRTGGEPTQITKNYYKKGNFCATVSGADGGKQVYNPKDSLHYSWAIDSTNAFTMDSRNEMEVALNGFTELDTTAIISNIECKAMKVKMRVGSVTYWYNDNYLKYNGKDYKGTLAHKDVIEKLQCLPIKIVMLGAVEIKMMEFKNTPLKDDIFFIPKFEKVDNLEIPF